MKIMFMGTPDFARTNLQKLVESGFDVCAVVSQPDKPKGRKMELVPTPVKEYALSQNIDVYQPETLKDGCFQDVLEKYNPDVIIAVAYGKLLPKYILDYPELGCINVHGSLLPKYRGSAPVQWAVINGDKQTGVTTMFMNEGMDTGDILLQQTVDIDYNETSASLMEKMAEIGADLLVKTLNELGNIVPVKQDEASATHAPMLTKDMGKIDWASTAEEIRHKIYGLNPWPVTFFETKKGTVKVFGAEVINEDSKYNPGQVVKSDNSLVVQTGNGMLSITELQLQGKKRMNVQDFLRGCKFEEGETF